MEEEIEQAETPEMTELELLRERAKQLMFSAESSPEEKHEGLQMLLRACDGGDPEAQGIVGKMLLDDKLSPKSGSRIELAVDFLCRAARGGDISARSQLFRLRRRRYEETRWGNRSVDGPLTGFDGKPIRINRTGFLTPVDAVLAYENGRNVLTFNLNLTYIEDEEGVPDLEKVHDAVIRGIKSWEGDYTVFGGQQLHVDIRVTTEPRWFDTVVVAVCGGEYAETLERTMAKLPFKRAQEKRRMLFRDNRACAGIGMKKWSVRSRKFIFLRTRDGRLDDYEEITNVIRHEFGHVLGLGDLYAEPENDLPGVPAGTYPELDAYVAAGRAYNLVMCHHDGAITDNDMEMVVLAFAQNRPQVYQANQYESIVSDALGKGN